MYGHQYLLSYQLLTMEFFKKKNFGLFIAHFLFILSITLPFDIRDLRSDYGNKIITVPNVIGLLATKAVAIISLVAFSLIIFSLENNLSIFYLTIIAGLLIWFSSPKRENHYYTIFIDATILIYFGVVKYLSF